jgi:hypothetical protein
MAGKFGGLEQVQWGHGVLPITFVINALAHMFAKQGSLLAGLQ